MSAYFNIFDILKEQQYEWKRAILLNIDLFENYDQNLKSRYVKDRSKGLHSEENRWRRYLTIFAHVKLMWFAHVRSPHHFF